ncbi:MAG: hypothetical protein PUB00_09650 [Clostridiales bacterium]|nr:hypothetical protein [Clostridiales bacterium]
MRKAKGKTLLILAFTLISILCCCTLSAAAVNISSDVDTESSFSEDIVSEALEIINMAGEEGLTESALKQLADLGLTDSQIEMLKNFSLAENSGPAEDTDRLFDSWITKQSGWNDHSSVLLLIVGIIIAGGLIGLLLVVRKLFLNGKFRRKSSRRHFVSNNTRKIG